MRDDHPPVEGVEDVVLDQVASVLIEHHRSSIEGCRCGWADLGRSHAAHVAAVLARGRLLAGQDQRIAAWEAVAAHPALAPAYDDGDVLLPAVLRRLDSLALAEEC